MGNENYKKSLADVAFCKTNKIRQNAENMFALCEVKTSITWKPSYHSSQMSVISLEILFSISRSYLSGFVGRTFPG